MLGFYENFPQGTHLTEKFNSTLTTKRLQRRLIQVFFEINQDKFSFEEVCNPTVPNCTLIFEFGIAEEGNFTYLNDEEAKRLQTALSKDHLQVMDWFCAIRYYKNANGKKTPLKFDYYMLRAGFSEEKLVEMQVFHEKGLQYVSPADLVEFVMFKVNAKAKRKVLRFV